MTITTNTSIELGPLVDLRDEIAPTLADLCERIDNDDREAFERGAALLERERQIIVELAGQLGGLAASDQTRRRAVESLNDALTELCVTGDLYASVDSYRERISARAVDGIVAAFDGGTMTIMTSCTCTVHDDYRHLDRQCPEHGDAAEERRRRGEAQLAELEALGGLLSGVELAEPLVQALHGFYEDVGREDRVHLLIERVERAEFDKTVDVEVARAELGRYVEEVERATQLVRATVASFTVKRSEAVVGAMDLVLRSIAGTMEAESVLRTWEIQSMIEASERSA